MRIGKVLSGSVPNMHKETSRSSPAQFDMLKLSQERYTTDRQRVFDMPCTNLIMDHGAGPKLLCG